MVERGRPKKIEGMTRVRLCVGHAKRLQNFSLRRKIVDSLVALGGSASLEQLNTAFGFDVREDVIALLRDKWLAIVEDEK